ncbi:MAG: hypothetical protein ACXWC3_28590, partial [Burkholderiales bacterium]
MTLRAALLPLLSFVVIASAQAQTTSTSPRAEPSHFPSTASSHDAQGERRIVEASGQAYPTRSIRIIIPFAPGGANDVVFRMITPDTHRWLADVESPRHVRDAAIP